MDIKDLIRETWHIGHQLEDLTKQYADNKLRIQKYFDKNDVKTINVELDDKIANGTSIVVTKTEAAHIAYFMDVLKANLPKDTYDEIINKSYSINDIQGMISLVRKAGVDPVEFKKFIVTDTSINKERIKQLYDLGDITKDHLKNAYTAQIVKSIRITERKGGKN